MGRVVLKNAAVGLMVWAAVLLGPLMVFGRVDRTIVLLGGGWLFAVSTVAGIVRDRRRAHRTAP